MKPLSSISLEVLARIERSPVPRQEINPGVTRRLLLENLVEMVELPSPYRTVKGNVNHLRITTVGQSRLKEIP